MQFKQIKATATYTVRHSVLRKGLPLSSCTFDRDEDNSTIHLGAFLENRAIGILTLLTNTKNVQIRGMAVLEKFQGKGIGKQLIAHAENLVHGRNICTIWMNARRIAVPFYKRCGYRKQGDAFELPYGGTHFKMIKSLCD
ncbi:MAG: GNAT family N-acetyltransferase [Flavobacteriaceae bacterium]|nr:GNAT family N-acetyltransferase [Flavobacteriaceae bacterium]